MISYVQSFFRALGLDERRKARNFLLKPAFQLGLPVYILLLSFTFLLLALLLGSLYFEQVYATMMANTTQAEYLESVISQRTGGFKSMALLLLAVYTVLVVVITTVYTHRMLGPVRPISRHIQALQEGLYSHRVSLRKHDALQELAEQLNALAEVLEQRSKAQQR